MSATTTPIAPPRPVTPTSILGALLTDVCAELDDVDGAAIGGELRAKLRRAEAIAVGLDPYLSECTTPPSDGLTALAERTRSADWSRNSADAIQLEQEMLSGHVEGQVLQFLVHLSGARRVLEIGMFTGYSALAMAEALPDDGELVACEIDAEVAAFARECFDRSTSGDKIDVRVAPAMDTLADLAAAQEAFDLVFLDADKGGYTEYVGALLESDLLAPDGVICVDNTLLQGEPYLEEVPSENGDAIAAFNQALIHDPTIEQVLIPLRDGLTLIRRA